MCAYFLKKDPGGAYTGISILRKNSNGILNDSIHSDTQGDKASGESSSFHEVLLSIICFLKKALIIWFAVSSLTAIIISSRGAARKKAEGHQKPHRMEIIVLEARAAYTDENLSVLLLLQPPCANTSTKKP